MEDCLFSTLPIKAMVQTMKVGLPATVSNTAGTCLQPFDVSEALYLADKKFPNMSRLYAYSYDRTSE